MIISEKQIIKLIRIADCYCSVLHKFGEYKDVIEIQEILMAISNQQSEELKEID